ncbi:MAG: hypothetical protein WCF30_01365 [Terracidiphilus sp.]
MPTQTARDFRAELDNLCAMNAPVSLRFLIENYLRQQPGHFRQLQQIDPYHDCR